MTMRPNGEGMAQARRTRSPLVRLGCYIAALAVTVVAATNLTRALVPPAPSRWHDLILLKNALLPVALFVLYGFLVRLMEHRTADEIDLREGWPALLIGALAGAGTLSVVFLILWALGSATIAPGTGLQGVERELLVPAVTAMGEELLFRVVLLGLLEEIGGSLFAIIVSAALFGLAHAGNPGATPLALAAVAIDLGFPLALAYLLTRNIWLAIGLHAAWNFAEGYIFGAYDSGMRDPHVYFPTNLSGPDLLTGGAFGPEASIVTLGLGLTACAVLFGLVRRHHHWRPMRLVPSA